MLIAAGGILEAIVQSTSAHWNRPETLFDSMDDEYERR